MRTKSVNHGERGIALLFVLFALLLLTGIAATLMFMTDTETVINTNYRSTQQAYFMSKAGLEEAKDRLRVNPADPTSISGILPGDILPAPVIPVMPGVPNGVVYVVNPNSDPAAAAPTPWILNSRYWDNQLCRDYRGVAGMTYKLPGQACDSLPAGPGWFRNPPTVTSLAPATAATLPYKWTRITWKANGTVAGSMVNPALPPERPVCWDGVRQRVLPAGGTCAAMNPAMVPVYLLTSLAVTQNGARRTTQMEVAKHIMRVPSALTLDGEDARVTFGTPHSAKFGISGNDICTGAVVPAIGVVSPEDDTGVSDALFRPDNYTGEGGFPSVIDLTTPADPPRLTGIETVGDLKKLTTDITTIADQIFKPGVPVPAGALGIPGNPATSKITVIQGDFPGPCDGQGVLLITGNATCGGNTKFDGLILIIGKGALTTNGGGNGAINGALLVANLFDSAGKELPDSSKPGVPTFDWNGGGINFIQYDSCKILDAMNRANYRLLAMREVNH